MREKGLEKLNNTKEKKKNHVPFRMNMLFFIVFLLFSLLILRLGVIQIVYGEDAKREVERTEDVTVNKSVPRGKIYDRKHRLIVDNDPKKAITYTIPNQFDQEKTLETAQALAKLINKDTEKITERDKIDYWLMTHPDEAAKKVTKAELEKYKDKNDEIYKLQRDRVTKEELASLTQDDLEVLAIYREFTGGYALTQQIVKNEDVTTEEYAQVSERLSELPGVDTTTDWERKYTYGETLRSILGGVSNGLPSEKQDYYMSRGYSRNDRVGKSYIELQYEDVLRGQKEKIKNITRSGAVIETKVLHEGQRGKDLILTIDMELQEAVDQIIEEELRKTKMRGGTGLLDRAFVTLMDPYTGEILAMSGKQYAYDEDEGRYKFSDFAAGNFTTSYVVGSSVKGASVLTGYMSGAIAPGRNVLLDEPIVIKGSKPKSSHFNRGGYIYLNDHTALVRSSNVYMYKIAIAVGDGQYRRGQSLIIDKEKAFREMRMYFSQFGLGIRTGIDLPGEQIGFRGSVELADGGNVLDFAIGQYDSYTPLQLAQYVSTIANGGYRMQPHVVKEIRDPSNEKEEIGPLAQEIKPKVLNRINAQDSWIQRVQGGFWGVFHEANGTGRAFASEPYRPAGKTGTAETVDRGTGVWNLSLVAYAPYENPEVAMAVIVPSAYVKGGTPNSINSEIGKRVLKAYFDLKNKKDDAASEETNEDQGE
ncbi:penicillin-binding protein 2 [Siminovitchia acidinfaciens]|uniref:serine-type D-Ala-D-Ala carboxypeptidase n=1 Tax=Siminovitchia acidinfaciens TaxID=2321395 RepID=A0A429XYL0_9BACI|nr:penicillin-binding protein 2 [Siminovitchia acidinfaciens]RST73824.1 penicillin-binding protein 2 [Siminovitchia acidinfaciens]